MHAHWGEVLYQAFGEEAVGFFFRFGEDDGLTRESMRNTVQGGLLFSCNTGWTR